MQPAIGASNDWQEPGDAVSPDLQQVWKQHMIQHPILAYVERTGDGQAKKISDFLSLDQFQRLGLYNEFFRPLRIEDDMSMALSLSPGLVIGIALHRSRPTFSERDRQLLNLLRPHLVQAYRNAQAVTRMTQELALVEQGVTELDRGVIVLTREAHVRLITDRARQWVATYFEGGVLPTDRLPDDLWRWVRHQEWLDNATDVPNPREPLTVERSGMRLMVRLVEGTEHKFLLLEEQQTSLQPAALESLGLSRREAEVLAWVAQGRSNHAIGVLLGCSELTVKKHLEHIYDKLGVLNRTEAAARALQQRA
jgi:DNA-binding CsgD family transcriptional regulator